MSCIFFASVFQNFWVSTRLADSVDAKPDGLLPDRIRRGRAIIAPVVILADEPTGNLDTATSRKLCELMHWLSTAEGRTIVTVTHDPAVAVWTQRVMVLKDGHVISTINTSTCPTAGELGVR
jgi:putative ABC transport system ATP-binding protein